MVKFDDNKGVIWRRKSKKDRQHIGQQFDDTKGVIWIRKSKKDRQHNGQVWRYQRGNLKP